MKNRENNSARAQRRLLLKPEPPVRYYPLYAPFDELRGTNEHLVHNPVLEVAQNCHTREGTKK